MREDFLHYLWRLGRFDLRDLRTTEGQAISIQNFGEHNERDAGPDFLSAQLRIDSMQWAGQIEIHIRSSDWFLHDHHIDPAYDNVILHVVLEEDEPARDTTGRRIPCLELSGRIPAGLLRSYWRLMHNEYWVPCQTQLHTIDELRMRSWLDRLAVERLEKRAGDIRGRLVANRNDWETTFYEFLARSFGGRVNDQAMQMLARAVPLKVALKHKHSLLQLEALYFGQAGLLPESSDHDDYVAKLKREYALLAHKYELRAISKTTWRYLRLRPSNFPTIRIAQLVTLIHQSGQLFSKVLAAANAKELENTFELKVSRYWRSHYRFGKTGKAGDKRLGIETLRSILINAIAPIYLLYGQERQEEKYSEKALRLLTELPAEKNTQIRQWRSLGVVPEHAADTQALLRLKREYCDQSRCLECAIGCQILNKPEPFRHPHLTLNEEAQLYRIARA